MEYHHPRRLLNQHNSSLDLVYDGLEIWHWRFWGNTFLAEVWWLVKRPDMAMLAVRRGKQYAIDRLQTLCRALLSVEEQLGFQ